MKYLLIALGFASAFAAQASQWKAESTELYLSAESQPVQKSSQVSETKQNKSSQEQPAKHLESRPEAISHNEFWIYDAWVVLHRDVDTDGYYSRFSLTFDADTVYGSAPVYARLYLGRTDTFREYHTTSVFNLLGDSTDDEFSVETTLVEGFISDDYEILIELYDADSGERVAIYDGLQDNDLYLLPLESSDYEYVPPPVQVVVSQESGGSLGWLALLGLLSLLACRRIRWCH
ncbi:choice-of-anchor H family protein [Aliiglaciecola sp. CAU 1673]|uniref:choice-of-anchor H family protein n=1 Tax=Aliiglaciecola sp. CAU 1673 TaxID=3032595 RepID=UPI0023DB9B05|nr:choice-of-anchor H family protein [Aliiglaciecola sp. CAU 1673]MDF2179697.1 choice-of-anchor H family protein [Aliiglaciecola sp. CAU 1673]